MPDGTAFEGTGEVGCSSSGAGGVLCRRRVSGLLDGLSFGGGGDDFVVLSGGGRHAELESEAFETEEAVWGFTACGGCRFSLRVGDEYMFVF